jgi:hypothetical protein
MDRLAGSNGQDDARMLDLEEGQAATASDLVQDGEI